MSNSTLVVTTILSSASLSIITTLNSGAATTVTTTTGTHVYGKFDNTHTPENTTSTGTHKYGRFDKTAEGTATAVIANNANSNKFYAVGAYGAMAAAALLAF